MKLSFYTFIKARNFLKNQRSICEIKCPRPKEWDKMFRHWLLAEIKRLLSREKKIRRCCHKPQGPPTTTGSAASSQGRKNREQALQWRLLDGVKNRIDRNVWGDPKHGRGNDRRRTRRQTEFDLWEMSDSDWGLRQNQINAFKTRVEELLDCKAKECKSEK